MTKGSKHALHEHKPLRNFERQVKKDVMKRLGLSGKQYRKYVARMKKQKKQIKTGTE